QKVVEETPSLAVTPATRTAMTAAAAAVARAVAYTNAGTIEFLLDEDGRFYFPEINTRLHVEQPITEMVPGVDLRRWQIRDAAAGIRTTVPFFQWLCSEPAFASGAFHTTYLDEVLAGRNGRSFVEPTPEIEDVAVMAAALHDTFFNGVTPVAMAAPSSWRAQ